MKIKVKEKTYDEVMAMQPYRNRRPEHQGKFWRWVMKTASAGELKKVGFELTETDMDRLGADEPALYLMNHSCFLDLEIASSVIYPRPFHVVCTLDGFVGKEWLMRRIGCIPTRKFMTDTALVRDMIHAAGKLRESILLYPEASYTFDGTATPLPESMGKLLKLLKIPVVMIRTYGAFQRDPLYNNLQLRDVNVRAEMSYVLSPEEIAAKSTDELNDILKQLFTFDNFRWQRDNKVAVNEPYRADSLDRVLYKCPNCLAEGEMLGAGTRLKCNACGKIYELTEYGEMRAVVPGDGDTVIPDGGAPAAERSSEPVTEFDHIPGWYAWERDSVREEIERGEYMMEAPVDIIALVNTDAVYRIGSGWLRHDAEGFHLTGCDGRLKYTQGPGESYSLYSDYYWYEIGDMVSIGTPQIQYYCFPKDDEAADNGTLDEPGRGQGLSKKFLVAKARLATEEMYKLSRAGRKQAERNER